MGNAFIGLSNAAEYATSDLMQQQRQVRAQEESLAANRIANDFEGMASKKLLDTANNFVSDPANPQNLEQVHKTWFDQAKLGILDKIQSKNVRRMVEQHINNLGTNLDIKAQEIGIAQAQDQAKTDADNNLSFSISKIRQDPSQRAFLEEQQKLVETSKSWTPSLKNHLLPKQQAALAVSHFEGGIDQVESLYADGQYDTTQARTEYDLMKGRLLNAPEFDTLDPGTKEQIAKTLDTHRGVLLEKIKMVRNAKVKNEFASYLERLNGGETLPDPVLEAKGLEAADNEFEAQKFQQQIEIARKTAPIAGALRNGDTSKAENIIRGLEQEKQKALANKEYDKADKLSDTIASATEKNNTYQNLQARNGRESAEMNPSVLILGYAVTDGFRTGKPDPMAVAKLGAALTKINGPKPYTNVDILSEEEKSIFANQIAHAADNPDAFRQFVTFFRNHLNVPLAYDKQHTYYDSAMYQIKKGIKDRDPKNPYSAIPQATLAAMEFFGGTTNTTVSDGTLAKWIANPVSERFGKGGVLKVATLNTSIDKILKPYREAYSLENAGDLITNPADLWTEMIREMSQRAASDYPHANEKQLADIVFKTTVGKYYSAVQTYAGTQTIHASNDSPEVRTLLQSKRAGHNVALEKFKSMNLQFHKDGVLGSNIGAQSGNVQGELRSKIIKTFNRGRQDEFTAEVGQAVRENDVKNSSYWQPIGDGSTYRLYIDYQGDIGRLPLRTGIRDGRYKYIEVTKQELQSTYKTTIQKAQTAPEYSYLRLN